MNEVSGFLVVGGFFVGGGFIFFRKSDGSGLRVFVGRFRFCFVRWLFFGVGGFGSRLVFCV